MLQESSTLLWSTRPHSCHRPSVPPKPVEAGAGPGERLWLDRPGSKLRAAPGQLWPSGPLGLCFLCIEDRNTSQNRVFGGLDIMSTEHSSEVIVPVIIVSANLGPLRAVSESRSSWKLPPGYSRL